MPHMALLPRTVTSREINGGRMNSPLVCFDSPLFKVPVFILVHVYSLTPSAHVLVCSAENKGSFFLTGGISCSCAPLSVL